MSFIKILQQNKKKIYIYRRKKKYKNIHLKRSEKLQADQITTLGGSNVHSPFFFLQKIYLFISITSFHFFYEPF